MRDLNLDRLQQSVVAAIAQAQYGEALAAVKTFVEEIINDAETVGVIFASRELDAMCERLADQYYRNVEPLAQSKSGTVIMATELVRAGGHVELIKDYLKLGLFESPVHLVLTDLFNRVDEVVVDEWSSRLGCEVFVARAHGLDAKLAAVSSRIAELAPSTLVTLGHNQDAVCVVAAHAPGIAKRYYVHHGDHHLSLGVTCGAFEHVDLHNSIFNVCRNEIGVKNQHYWPLSSDSPAEIKTQFYARDGLTTCSCGRMSKFEAGSYAFRYERAVALLLKASGGFHVHIGDLTSEFLGKIHEEMDALEISRDRFIHVEWVPSLSKALLEHSVDVFFSSVPLGGGKALIEAMSVGVPVVTHESYRSRHVACFDLAYPDSYIWANYEDIVRIFGNWNESLLKAHSMRACLHFEKFYSEQAFLLAFYSAINCSDLIPALAAYHPNRLQRYIEIKTKHIQHIERLESEGARVFNEWKVLFFAYEKCKTEIEEKQVLIEELTQNNRALEASLQEYRRRSWKVRVARAVAAIRRQ